MITMCLLVTIRPCTVLTTQVQLLNKKKNINNPNIPAISIYALYCVVKKKTFSLGPSHYEQKKRLYEIYATS